MRIESDVEMGLKGERDGWDGQSTATLRLFQTQYPSFTSLPSFSFSSSSSSSSSFTIISSFSHPLPSHSSSPPYPVLFHLHPLPPAQTNERTSLHSFST